MTKHDDANLLFGSRELTAEENCIRAELMDWMQERLKLNARPIALQAALTICAERMKNPEAYGLERSPLNMNSQGYRQQFGKVKGP